MAIPVTYERYGPFVCDECEADGFDCYSIEVFVPGVMETLTTWRHLPSKASCRIAFSRLVEDTPGWRYLTEDEWHDFMAEVI